MLVYLGALSRALRKSRREIWWPYLVGATGYLAFLTWVVDTKMWNFATPVVALWWTCAAAGVITLIDRVRLPAARSVVAVALTALLAFENLRLDHLGYLFMLDDGPRTTLREQLTHNASVYRRASALLAPGELVLNTSVDEAISARYRTGANVYAGWPAREHYESFARADSCLRHFVTRERPIPAHFTAELCSTPLPLDTLYNL